MPGIDVGLQFHLPSHKNLTLQQLIELAQMAESGGIRQLWVTDNLLNRNAFVVLAALASHTSDLDLGTAIMVQYFRSPVDVAGSLASISELMIDSSELSVGLGRGNIRTSQYIDTPKPLSMMAETASALSDLLAGSAVHASDYPALSAYFNFADGAHFEMNFTPRLPIRIYCGAYGPKALAIGGRHMDGLLCGTTFRAITKMGHLPRLLEVFDDAAAGVGKNGVPRRVVEVKISLHEDGDTSREFARKGVGSRVIGLRWLGYESEDIAKLGISPEGIDRLEAAKRSGGRGTSQELAPYVTDEMIDAFYIAGTIDQCKEQVEELISTAEEHGFQQIIFSGVSPEFEDGVRLLIDEVMPSFA